MSFTIFFILLRLLSNQKKEDQALSIQLLVFLFEFIQFKKSDSGNYSSYVNCSFITNFFCAKYFMFY